MNTSEFLMISSAIVPDRPVMFFDDEAITFSEFQERVNKLANALSDQGVVAGDRVAMMQMLGKITPEQRQQMLFEQMAKQRQQMASGAKTNTSSSSKM